MKIKFLGTGGAFMPHKGNASAIVELQGKKILIDCGYATLQTLIEKDLVKEIDYILITHLHADHIGSFPSLLAYTEVKLDKRIEIIYPTESFKNDIHSLLTLTFAAKRAHYISIDEFTHIGFIDTFGLHIPEMRSHAYYFTEGHDLIYYSGDLGQIDATLSFLNSRKEKNIKVFHDIHKKGGSVHVNYLEAQVKLSNWEAYGYHCDKSTMPSDCAMKLVEDYSKLNY